MIFIYGNGGRAKLIKELLLRINFNQKFKFFRDLKKVNIKLINNYLISDSNSKFYIGISDPIVQKRYYQIFKKKIVKVDQKPIIDPSAIIKSNVIIGKNSIILENAVIGPNVKLGKNVFVGSNAIINHDSKVGNFTTVGHGVNIAGRVKISNECFIGISSIIKPNIKIGNQVKIGSGSNVVKHCESKKIYYGNPAKKQKENDK